MKYLLLSFKKGTSKKLIIEKVPEFVTLTPEQSLVQPPLLLLAVNVMFTRLKSAVNTFYFFIGRRPGSSFCLDQPEGEFPFYHVT